MNLTYKDEPDLLSQIILIECAKAGVKRVAICCTDAGIPSSMSFPFGPSHSIFANERTETGIPSIWNVAYETGLNAGCGNADQYQIDTGGMIEPGAWQLRGSTWHRVNKDAA